MASHAVDSDLARPVSPYSLAVDELTISTFDRSQALRSRDDLLRSIHGGGGGDQEEEEEEAYGRMTLEDFLARAGAVKEEDFRVLSENPQVLGFGSDAAESGRGWGIGRRRKRPVLDPIDNAAIRRQRRMIKNRESAARSRERKQAYTLELESLAAQLEEENARLLKEQEEFKWLRLKEIKENITPPTEKKIPAPPSPLRRTQSTKW